jgi:hypothetical protein
LDQGFEDDESEVVGVAGAVAEEGKGLEVAAFELDERFLDNDRLEFATGVAADAEVFAGGRVVAHLPRRPSREEASPRVAWALAEVAIELLACPGIIACCQCGLGVAEQRRGTRPRPPHHPRRRARDQDQKDQHRSPPRHHFGGLATASAFSAPSTTR